MEFIHCCVTAVADASLSGLISNKQRSGNELDCSLADSWVDPRVSRILLLYDDFRV